MVGAPNLNLTIVPAITADQAANATAIATAINLLNTNILGVPYRAMAVGTQLFVTVGGASGVSATNATCDLRDNLGNPLVGAEQVRWTSGDGADPYVSIAAKSNANDLAIYAAGYAASKL